MKPARWARRAARTVRELVLRAVTYRRGVRLILNGMPIRVAAPSRFQFAVNYDGPVATFLRDRIRDGAEVWNVGANVGVYTLQLGAWVGPHGRVLAFEPNPRAAQWLTENVHLNRLHDRVEIVRSAIGGMEGKATLYAHRADGMSRIGRPNAALVGARPVVVPITTLDEVAERRQQRPSWVIMDIEGLEIAALEAARCLLRHTCFVIELHPSLWPWSGHSRNDLENLLQDHGLQAVGLNGQADPLSEHGQVFIDRVADA